MWLQDIFIKYWWIFALIGAIISFYLYSNLSVYTKKQISKIFNNKVLLIGSFIISWYLWARQGNISTIAEAHRWMPIIALFIIASYNYIGKLQYGTQQFISPNFHGSYSQNPKYIEEAGMYAFAIDTFNFKGISWDYASRIVIVKEETVELFNEGAVSIAQINFISKYELPDSVKNFIENNKYFKRATQEVYYGWFDSFNKIDWDLQKLKELEELKKDRNGMYSMLKKELNVSNPKVSTLFWMYKNLCKAVNKQTEWYDATVESTEKGVEHQKRVKDAYVDKQDPPQRYEGGEENY